MHNLRFPSLNLWIRPFTKEYIRKRANTIFLHKTQDIEPKELGCVCVCVYCKDV